MPAAMENLGDLAVWGCSEPSSQPNSLVILILDHPLTLIFKVNLPQE